MFKKIKKSSQTRSIAKKMEKEAANMVAVLTPISDRREHAAAVLEAVNAGEWSAENLTLVETRITGGYAGASTPVKIGGQTIRLGGAVPVKKEEMTAIDTGTWTVNSDGMSFVGGKHTRKWEFKKLVGYLDTGTNELLVGVENRQKMSGIRYNAKFDFFIDALFTSFYTVHSENGDTASIHAWAAAIEAECADEMKQIVDERGAILASLKAELSDAGASDAEVEAVMSELPIAIVDQRADKQH
jgi:hypothetical protein